MMNRLSQKAIVANAIPKDDASETTDTSNQTIPTAIPVDDPTFILAATHIRQSARRVVSGASTSVSSNQLSLPIVALSVMFGVVLSAFVCMTQHTPITRVEWERLQRAHVELNAVVSKTQSELERLQRAHVELNAVVSKTQTELERLQSTHVELNAVVSKTQTELESLMAVPPCTPACAPSSPCAGTRASSTAPPGIESTRCSPPPTRP